VDVSDSEQRFLALQYYTYSAVTDLFVRAPFATLTQDRLHTRINFFTLDACHTRRASDHRYTSLDGKQEWEAKCVFSPELIGPSLILVFESAIPAQILQKRPHEVYVHYVDTDKRVDEWVPEGSCQLQELSDQQGPPTFFPSRTRHQGHFRDAQLGHLRAYTPGAQAEWVGRGRRVEEDPWPLGAA